jgi:hypothetical protein
MAPLEVGRMTVSARERHSCILWSDADPLLSVAEMVRVSALARADCRNDRRHYHFFFALIPLGF